MKKLIVDCENTTTKLTDKYTDYSPYNPNNKLVSIGWAWLEDGKVGKIGYSFFYHKEKDLEPYSVKELDTGLIQCIKEADVLIAHNAKYDLQWLAEAGFDVLNKQVEDTMIREYVMARGRSDFSLRLADTCKRYKVTEKGELFEKYPDLQISEMPIGEVEEYGRGDIKACGELYIAQQRRLDTDSYQGLKQTVEMMEEFCRVLADMERTGVKIDMDALEQVKHDFTNEAAQLETDLYSLVRKYMGDTDVNLDSPQQLSEVIYSRRVKPGCEDEWVSTFNIGRNERNKPLRRPKLSFTEYRTIVHKLSDIVLRQRVEICSKCRGAKLIQKTKKDGTLFKKEHKCKACKGTGVVYFDLNEVGGFCMKPMNVNFTTIGGFSTSKVFLKELIEQARHACKTDAAEFLTKLMRLSAISSYLSNFVGGIKAFSQADNILHPNFNQCITSTGRLSSTKPNLQNQPREATFPIRKVFKSRWADGCIAEMDFKQLEFRAAVDLAKCESGKQDILNGIDIHNQTKDIITENGQIITRQEAKSHTFKPLYGGVTGTDAERAYYRTFLTKVYTGIGEWHKRLEEEAIRTLMVTIPTGRQFIFPDIQRAWHGGSTSSTQVKNFPVQAYATADIVPISTIRLWHEMRKLNLNSRIVLNVHDSIVVDTYKGEEEIVVQLLKQVGKYAEEELFNRYSIITFVPFDVDVKIGQNLMEMEKAA